MELEPDQADLPVETPRQLVGRSSLRRVHVIIGGVLLLAALATGYALNEWRVSTGHDRFEKACLQARREGDWDYMRQTAEEWLRWSPGRAQAMWFAAESAQQQDRHDDLIEILDGIPRTDPNIAFGLAEKAGLQWSELNKPLQALQTSLEVLAIEPRHVDSHSRVISFYAMTLQRVRMLEAIRAAIRAGAEPREAYCYLIMSDALSFTNGAELNQRWLRGAPDDDRFKIALAVTTAMDLAASRESSPTEEVLELNREANLQLEGFLETWPGDPILLTFLMHQAYRNEQVQKMEKLLGQVTETLAQDHMVWVYKAWYHTMVDELEEAEEAIIRAIRIHPLSQLAHQEYAKILCALQRPEVEREQQIAAYGRELRSEIMRQPSAADLSLPLLVKIMSYADSCGDTEVAAALAARL